MRRKTGKDRPTIGSWVEKMNGGIPGRKNSTHGHSRY